MPEIIDGGVSCLKIEGRYKDVDYVALTTQAYRQAVDAAWAHRADPVTARQELELEQVYSRGLGPYFASGVNHQARGEWAQPAAPRSADRYGSRCS